MRSSIQGTALPVTFAAILSLFVLLCAPVPSARAGCSAHYVTSNTQADAEAFALDPLPLSGPGLAPRENRPPTRPRPCSGALCSGNPLVPVSNAPSVVTQGDSHWAIPVVLPALANPGSMARPARDAQLVPVNDPAAIFHPPRHPHPQSAS
jgi:hypothetical protein